MDQLLSSETLCAACGEPSMYRCIGQRWNQTEDVSDKDGIKLKTKTNSCHLKPYVQRVANPPCTDVSDKDGIKLKMYRTKMESN